MHLLDSLHFFDWLRQVSDLAASPAVLVPLFLQLACILAGFLLAWGIRAATRSWTDRLVERVAARYRALRIPAGLRGLATFCYAWFVLVFAEQLIAQLGGQYRLIGIATSLTGLWIVIRASALLLRDPLLARAVATIAWVVAALDITGLLSPTETALSNLAITIGTLRLSVLLVIKAVFILAILLWIARGLARVVDTRLQRLSGVGIGFGLQKIVSNFVSGIILLLERSIKPGDVIEVGSTFGSVTYLGARYGSVRGRDGKEYLIPNENLITNQVINWSYSNSLVRLDVEFGVAYASDLHAVRDLAVEVAKRTKRVLASPTPLCHVTGFGDSAVNMLLRFWIEDPANGVTNIKGDVLLGLWDSFQEHRIEIPFPRREVHIRDLPPTAALYRAARSQAAED